MNRLHVAGQKIGEFDPTTVMQTCYEPETERSEDNIISLFGMAVCYSELENASLELIQLNETEVLRPYKPNSSYELSYWMQLEGEAVLRFGGWRQRQNGLVARAGDIVQIDGNGKRAIENPHKIICQGILADVTVHKVNQQIELMLNATS